MFVLSSLKSAAAVLGEAPESSAGLSENLRIGAEVALMGIGITFAILILLWGILELFRVLFSKKSNPEKTESLPETSLQTSAPAEQAQETDGGELIAVITAAVEAYRASEEGDAPRRGFRVVSFRKK